VLAAWFTAPETRRVRRLTAVLGGLKWDLNDFCRGWLITGDTGSGKTFAINRLLHSVFEHEPDWGGLCCDEKGIYHETLSAMVKKYGRQDDLVLLQTRPEGAARGWVPPARFNLLSDPGVPWSTYATAIVDTAASLSGGGQDKGFFKIQAQAHIGRGIQLMRLLKMAPTMHHLLEMLQYQQVLKAMLRQLEPLKNQSNLDASDCYEHFQNGYLRQPGEQLGGVISTIYNYLNYFTNPDIVEVFGAAENTFELSALDQGAIVCISLPQKYQTERRYITTLMKMLFYTHALRRYDPRPPGKRTIHDDNLLICWQDEAQRFITESDGNVDVIRQARTTVVLAAQSKLSFLPALGSREKADVTLLNLRNRIIFKAADRSCAESSADFIGKRLKWKKSYTRGRGATTVTRTREEEYLVKPYELMNLSQFAAVVKHCEKPHKRVSMRPILSDGSIPEWYSIWNRLFR
jgi:type IV secretion system coupling TraD/TrwB family protein